MTQIDVSRGILALYSIKGDLKTYYLAEKSGDLVSKHLYSMSLQEYRPLCGDGKRWAISEEGLTRVISRGGVPVPGTCQDCTDILMAKAVEFAIGMKNI